MQCYVCKTQLPVEAAYCPTCGRRLSDPSDSHASPPLSDPNQSPQETPSSASPLPLPSFPFPHTSKELALVALLFIIVVSSIGFGFFSVVKSNQAATASIKAAVQADATIFANTVGLASTVTRGRPILTDTLSSNMNGRWMEKATCVFRDNAYHVLAGTDVLQSCRSSALSFDNVAIQVDVSLLSGSFAGLIFRANGQIGHVSSYTFSFGVPQSFWLIRTPTPPYSARVIIYKAGISIINPGNRKNRLLVIAKGGDFKLYINGIFVGEGQDNTFSSGQIGFLAATLSATSANASFSNLQIFKV